MDAVDDELEQTYLCVWNVKVCLHGLAGNAGGAQISQANGHIQKI